MQSPRINQFPIRVRMRIRWGGGEESRWIGRIRVDTGSLENLKLLGLAPDSAGSIWLEDGEVRIASIRPHEANEIEFETAVQENSKFSIDLANVANGRRVADRGVTRRVASAAVRRSLG